LSQPRFEEDLSLVRLYIERSTQSVTEQTAAELPANLLSNKVLRISVERARDFMKLKEEAKHYCLIELAQIRRLLLSIDKRCNLDGRVFYLTAEELTEMADPAKRAQLGKLADDRYAAAQSWKSLQMPASLSTRDLERMDMLTGTNPNAVEQSELSGNRVAGEQEVTGVVRVITDIDQIHTFKQGEILVARMTDPTWYPLFSQAHGIITEIGGWLSHAAIVAREYDLPAIVGVTGACNQLKTGDLVRMSLSGSIEKLQERRDPVSPMRNLDTPTTASIIYRDEAANDELRDLSEGEQAQRQIYQLTARKLYSYQQSTERREMKNRLEDRRAEPRFDENGEMQQDRRSINRLANANYLRKAG
jgi:phosphohistidine swiveling domain-containing protein